MKFWKLVRKIILWSIGIVALGYVLLIGFLLFGPRLISYSQRTSFESSEWKSHLKDRDPVKLRMVDDLLSHEKLIGMDIKEINQLLGKPPATGYFKDYNYVYWLGPEPSAFGIDSEWLGIKFLDRKVIKVDILRD